MVEDHGDVEDYPAVAVLAALVAALTGKPADAERWAQAAEQGAVVASLPDRSLSIKPWLALLRALLAVTAQLRCRLMRNWPPQPWPRGAFGGPRRPCT